MSMKSNVRKSLKGFAAYGELWPFLVCLQILAGSVCGFVICATTQSGAVVLGSSIFLMCAAVNSPQHTLTVKALTGCLWCFAALLAAFNLTKGQGTALVAVTIAIALILVLHDIVDSDDDPE